MSLRGLTGFTPRNFPTPDVERFLEHCFHDLPRTQNSAIVQLIGSSPSSFSSSHRLLRSRKSAAELAACLQSLPLTV